MHQHLKHRASARKRPPLGRLRLLWLALMVFGLDAAVVGAKSISIVLSAEESPYVTMARDLETRLTAEGHSVQSWQLSSLEKRGDVKNSNPTGDETEGPDGDLFIGIGTTAAHWLYYHLPEEIPLVYCLVPKPPFPTGRRRVYGVVTEVSLEDQFAIIAEALPKARTLGMLYREGDPNARDKIRTIESALPEGMNLHAVAVDQRRSFAEAMEHLFEGDIDVVWTEPDAQIYNWVSVRSLLLGALRRRVPVFGFSASFVRSGSLAGAYIDLEKYTAQVVELSDAVLRRQTGSKDYLVRPVYRIGVNPIVARKLAVRLPESLLQRAEVLNGP